MIIFQDYSVMLMINPDDEIKDMREEISFEIKCLKHLKQW